MELFVYPPFAKSKPEFIDAYYDFEKELLIYSDVSRNNKYWNKIYKKIDKKYNVENKILPKNTLIYRGSSYPDPLDFKTKSPVIYFGLDFVISTWISLETYDIIGKNKDYYLHIYKLKEPLKYKYIYADIGTPIELDKDNVLKFPCIHPQVILHGNTVAADIKNELGTELTIPKKYKKIFTPINTFEVDVEQLRKHDNNYIFEWSPINAIK